MPALPRRPSFLARAAIGLWLCAIGALGFLQFYLRAFDDGGFDASIVAWLWLVGATLVSSIGGVAILRAARHPR